MIGIGVLSYRGWGRVKTLLGSIARRDPGVPREKMLLAVWDDGSPIEEFQAGKDSMTGYPVTVLRSPENRGIAPSWNALTRHLLERGAEQVFLFNDDIIVTDHWLGSAVYFLNENPHAGCVCWHQNFFIPEDTEALLADPTKVFPREPIRGRPKREALYNGAPSRPGRVPCPAGCAFGFTKRAWEQTDGFPDDFVSFHEESVAPERRTVVMDSTGRVTFPTHEELFEQFLGWVKKDGSGREFIPSPPIRVLSSSAGLPLWDSVDYLVRHPVRDRVLVSVRTKEGQTRVTEDHSLIVGGVATSPASLRERMKQAGALSGRALADALIAHPGASEACLTVARTVRKEQHLGRAGAVLGISRECVGVRLRSAAKKLGLQKGVVNPDTLEHVPAIPVQLSVDLAEYVSGADVLIGDTNIACCRVNIAKRLDCPKHISRHWRGAELANLLELVAAYVTEGSVVDMPKHNAYGVSIASGDKEWLIRMRELSRRVFPECATHIARSDKTPYAPVYSLRIIGKLPLRVFDGLCGRKSAYIHLPSFVFNLPPEMLTAHFKDLLRGDGFSMTRSTRPYTAVYPEKAKEDIWWYTTTSDLLACQVVFLAKMLGHSVSIAHNPNRGSYEFRSRYRANSRVDGAKFEESKHTGYVYDVDTTTSHTFVDAAGLLVLHNSDFGFTLTAQEHPAYVLNWPVVWHQLSATFAACPELKASSVMRRSRHLFSEKWNVPQALRETPFEHVHPLTMSGVPAYDLKWMTPDGPRADIDPRCKCTLCKDWRAAHAR